MLLDRRTFVASGAAGLILPFVSPAWASAQADAVAPTQRLALPLLAGDIISKHGFRPKRDGGFRLDVLPARIRNKRVINNYGHGGGGITLSWGCAKQVLDKLNTLPEVASAGASRPRIAVLGAGVIGLTTATILSEGGFDVTVYARDTDGNTTSDVAGGQFAPSVLGDGQDKQLLLRTVADSYREYLRRSRLPTPSYTIHKVNNYIPPQNSDLRDVYEALHPLGLSPETPEQVSYSIGSLNLTGFKYQTLLIEVPEMMAWLRRVNQVRAWTFNAPSDLDQLSETILINCLGAAGPRVSPDSNEMERVLGILAFLPPQPDLNYLFSGAGYVFPRANELVVGGWLGRPDLNQAQIDAVARKIVSVMSRLFKGGDIHQLPHCFSSGGTINRIKKPGAGADDATDLSSYCPD